MNESYNIYCVSNAENFENNDMTCFRNLLPQNLDLKNKQWEIGIVKFGFQFNTEKLKDLSMVSISTDVIIDSPNGNKYSTLVYDTSLLKSAQNKYFNHYVKHVKYYPIRNTFIDSITSKFVDINGQQLTIEKGRPSFVHFHLRIKDFKENYNMNYIRLDSENTDLEQKNTNNNFWVHLKDSMELNEDSEIALVNINFPNCIRNISSFLSQKHIKISIRMKKYDLKYNLNIPAAYYSSASSLIQVLNSIVPEEAKEVLKFSLNNDKLQIDSTHVDAIICKFPMEFKNIFGFDTNILSTELYVLKNRICILLLPEKPKYVASNPIDVMHDYPNIMLCYANFVKHSIVGNTYFPILKMIPTETPSEDKYTSVHFDHLEFIKTNIEYLKDLHFQLRRLDGNFIEFDDNKKIILNLVVKK